MSAPWFILPGTCVIFSECKLFWAHTRRSIASMQSRFETRPPWWFMYDTMDLLSEHISTWCPQMSGRKNWQAWHTASISRQFMCRPDSSSDHRPKVGLPSHSAPQPLLEASVMTTFLLCAVSRITPRLARRGPSNRPGLIHRPESPLRGGVCDARPQMEPSASARTGWVACEADPSEAFSGWAVPFLKEAAWRWIVVARSAETVAVDNCTQEWNLLAGWQYALGKVDPEPQTI